MTTQVGAFQITEERVKAKLVGRELFKDHISADCFVARVVTTYESTDGKRTKIRLTQYAHRDKKHKLHLVNDEDKATHFCRLEAKKMELLKDGTIVIR